MKRVLRVLAFAMSFASASAAQVSDRCSVTMKCSASGLECSTDDRACADTARERGLEIVCDRPDGPQRRFVYCPPGATARDSNVVWILLGVAALVAIVGAVVTTILIGRRVKR
jgi:hypothetical protein